MIYGVSRRTFPPPSRGKMLRFLKKRWKSHKSSKKSIPPEIPTHQTISIGAGVSDSEYFREDLRVDEADGTDKAIGPDTNHGGGSRITTQDRGAGDQQLLVQNASTLTPGNESGDASECSRLLLLGPMFIPCPDGMARTRTHTWLCRSAERATRSHYSCPPF